MKKSHEFEGDQGNIYENIWRGKGSEEINYDEKIRSWNGLNKFLICNKQA